MGSYLSHDAILRVDDRPTEDVRVPEWFDAETGADMVLVRGLDGRGRDSYFASMTTVARGRQIMDTTNATAKLVASCIVDPDDRDRPLFTLDEVDALGAKSGAALNRVFDAAQRLSGLSDDDLAELGETSAVTPNGRSTSASRGTSAARSKSS